MKIKEAHIYGFGKWVDQKIEFPQTGLVCCFGENESGKSTLQRFMMFMLFGLPPRERKFYHPKTSSRMGGRLIIEDEQIGIYSIERIDGVKNGVATCLLSNGDERDDIWLQKQLNSMTSDIYEAIFSFSAHDLIEIKQMKDQDLGEVLLNIGMTGYSNIYEIEKELNRELDELFRPQGTRPLINEQLTAIDEQNNTLLEIKREISGYHKQRETYLTIDDELKDLQERLENFQKEKDIIVKNINNLKTIHQYLSAKRQLGKLPSNITFPERGIERLQMIQGQVLPLESEHTFIKDNQEKLLLQYEAAKQKLFEQSIYEEGKTLLKLERRFEQNNNEISQLQNRLEKHNFEIENKLKQLQIDLSKDEIDSLTFPFHIEQQWNECKQRLERANREKSYIVEQLGVLYKQKEMLLTEQKQVKQHILNEQQKDIYENKLKQFTNYHDQQEIQQETIKRNKQWNQRQKKKKKQYTFILISSILLSVISACVAYIFNFSTFYFTALFVLAIGLGQFVVNIKSLRETEQFLQISNRQIVDKPVITKLEKSTIENLLAEDQNARRTLDTIAKELRACDLKVTEYKDRLTLLRETEEELDEKITNQISIYPFLNGIDVKYWPELYHPMRNLADLAEEVSSINEQKGNLEREKASIYEKLAMFLEKINKHDKGQSIPNMFAEIKACVEDHAQLLQQIGDYEKEISHAKKQQEDLANKMALYQKEIIKLYTIAQVRSEEEYYLQERKYSEQQKIEQEYLNAKEQLEMVYSLNEMKELPNKMLDEFVLKGERERIVKQISLLESKIEEKREQRAKLFAELQNLESSEAYSEAFHRLTMEKEKLSELAINWSILKTAHNLLIETKRSYQDKYLSKVIEQMKSHFTKITDGAYVEIFAPSNDHPFQVECVDGIRYTVNELSQGTIDQLYISLRIAMGEMVSGQHNVPFIIDDAFVHFDAKRLKRTIEILIEIASKQQIIVFTCKKELVNILQNQNVIYLDIYSPIRIK